MLRMGREVRHQAVPLSLCPSYKPGCACESVACLQQARPPDAARLRSFRQVCCVSPADLKLADRYAALCAKEAAAGDKKN